MQLAGFHHLTAVTANAVLNHRFYTGILGLRLVKKTVNQDDVSAYHLFYGDGEATAGSDITFFEWPLPPERRGSRSVVRTELRVGGADSLHWWAARFREKKVAHSPVAERDGRLTLDFEDPEGQRLCLVDDGGEGPAHPWQGSTVPPERQIRVLGPITISVAEGKTTETVLTGVLNMSRRREYVMPGGTAEVAVVVYEMGSGGCGGELHVAEEPSKVEAGLGAGGVHHVAFRAPGPDDYERWIRRLREHRIPSSGAVDRHYFKSLYFRDPSGILYEIATDGPGFAVDEPMGTLGTTLSLPPFLESRRREIEGKLAPLGD